MNTKYQIFVSSTYEDLREQREHVIRAILEMGHIPVGMEMFSAADEEQWGLIKKQIDQTDYYVVIIAHRYGSMDGDISYTEKEYDYAVSRKIPILAFVIDENTQWNPEFVDRDAEILARLGTFKGKAKKKMVSYWESSEDLYGKALIALMKTMNAHPRVGWVRSDEIPGPDIVREIARLSSENAQLRATLTEAELREEDTEDQVRELVDTLSRNPRKVYVWIDDAGNEDYDPDAEHYWKPFDSDLLKIFRCIAKEALDEAKLNTIRDTISFEHADRQSTRKLHPVPINLLKEWMADLASLNLIEPSQKRHSVHDENEYWTLTELGKTVANEMRKTLLKRGMESTTAPEEDTD